MRCFLTLPSRINILGNPGDANEGDFATISAAIELRAAAVVEPSDCLVLEARRLPPGQTALNPQQANSLPIVCRLEFDLGQLPLPYTGELDLIKSAINRLYRHSPEFRQKASQQGVHLITWSAVPPQSGLGGSSLFVLLALSAMRLFYELDPLQHNDYVLSELTQRAEALELGITCGYADRYVPLFGGLAYLDYRGKLQQGELDREPYATYERLIPGPLDQLGVRLPLVAVATGIRHQSGDVHGAMRPRYLQEQAEWLQRGGSLPPMLRMMQAAWQTAWQGKIALLHGDLLVFGRLMNENHRLVNEMMVYCGFEDGAGWANNLLIKAAQENGALGAKLTGAGSGGSVFALVPPGEERRLMTAWRKTAQKAGLDKACIYRPRIARQGLKIKQLS